MDVIKTIEKKLSPIWRIALIKFGASVAKTAGIMLIGCGELEAFSIKWLEELD